MLAVVALEDFLDYWQSSHSPEKARNLELNVSSRVAYRSTIFSCHHSLVPLVVLAVVSSFLTFLCASIDN